MTDLVIIEQCDLPLNLPFKMKKTSLAVIFCECVRREREMTGAGETGTVRQSGSGGVMTGNTLNTTVSQPGQARPQIS